MNNHLQLKKQQGITAEGPTSPWSFYELENGRVAVCIEYAMHTGSRIRSLDNTCNQEMKTLD